MQPKLIIGLNTLQKEEWVSFRKFVLMYTREESDNFRCFQLLQKQRDKLSQFESIRWHLKYMPEISEKAWLNILSKLYLWLEEWIVFNNLKKDKIRSGIELVKHFNRKGEFHLADLKSKQVQLLINRVENFSPDMLFYQYQLYYYQFYSDNPIKDTDQDLISNIVTAYLRWNNYNLSMHSTLLTYWSSIRNTGIEDYKDLKNQLEFKTNEGILYHLHNLVKNNELSSFSYCFNFLMTKKLAHNDDFFVLLTMYLLNKCHILWNENIIKDSEILVSLYEFALEENVLMNSGKLPFRRFLNIVNTLGVYKSYKWTNEFIERWAPMVNDDNLEGVILFGKAFNYFHRGEISKSLNLLNRINTKFINSRATLHRLAIMIYYESRDENYSKIIEAQERFSIFLRRRTPNLTDIQVRRNKNFISNTKLLLRKERNHKVYNTYLPSSNIKWIREKKKEMDQN